MFFHTPLTMLVVISPHLSLTSLSEAGWPSLPTVQKHDYSGRLVLGVLCVVTAVQGGGANGKLWNNFLSHLGMLRDFLMTMETLGWQPEQSCWKSLTIPQTAILQIELAAIIDAGAPLVKATYNLEGDGPLVWQCHEQISTVLNAINTAHYPNVTAVVERVAGGNRGAVQQMSTYASSCVKGAQDYFTQKMTGELKDLVSAFKAAKLFCPQRVVEIGPTAIEVDCLRVFPFLDDTSAIGGLKEELPQYLTLAADASHEIEPLDWWKRHETDLPKWSGAARKIVYWCNHLRPQQSVFSQFCTAPLATDSNMHLKITLKLLYNYNTINANVMCFSVKSCSSLLH